MAPCYLRILLAFLLIVTLPSALLAGTGPSASESSLTVAVGVHPNSAWGGDPLFWCPGGDGDTIVVTVQVNDASSDPCEDCDVELLLDVEHDVQDELGAGSSGRVCGTNPRTLTTDATGRVTFPVTGGGCGRFRFTLSATATCPGGTIALGPIVQGYCIQTPDFNGSLTVNFFDTFKYLPPLSFGTDFWCGDFVPGGVPQVNFFDTFKYLPHLAGGHSCSGFSTASAILGDCP